MTLTLTLTLTIDSRELARTLVSDAAWSRFDALVDEYRVASAAIDRRHETFMAALRPSVWRAWRAREALRRTVDAAMIDACRCHYSGLEPLP